MEFKSDEHQGPPIPADEWIAEVKEILGARDGDRVSKRVPEVVAKSKPEAYVPQILSLGPYHHSALQDAPDGVSHNRLSHISSMDKYKLKCVRDAAGNNVFDTISELEQFYDWKVEMQDGSFRKFRWMMAADALFLYQFLNKVSLNHDPEESGRPLAMGSIKCDIVKLENQVPLSLLKKVHETLKPGHGFDKFLQRRMASLCSFDGKVEENEGLRVEKVGEDQKVEEKQKVREEQHLLGYMHKYVSSFLRIKQEKEAEPGCCKKIQIAIGEAISNMCRILCFLSETGQVKLKARKLVKHGITLTAFTPGEKKQEIRFDRYSDTLYLPKLTVTDIFTEVVLRNLLALEFIETSRGKVVAQYVELMNSLIHSAKDVKVLRKCGVIVPGNSTVSDADIATMWKDICKPFFAVSVQASLQEGIKKSFTRNYYKVVGRDKCLVYGARLMLGPLTLIKTVINPTS